MTNFCCSSLKPSIICSSVCTDGYEVTNLISSDNVKLQKGFLAYNAIKPPVRITLKFMCSVNVSHIVLWPQVGYQKSTGFEIYACPTGIVEDYQKVGFGYLKQDEVGMIFYRGVHHSYYIKSTEHLHNFARRAMRGNMHALLNNTSEIQINIIKTNSSVPALAKIEVWGQPSKSCDQVTISTVKMLWNKKMLQNQTSFSVESIEKSQTVCISEPEFEIPEEFLDPITCTIMALPFILPCGKIVDRSTLDKHEQHEGTWGRNPSDPFTGILFSESSRPILASALKARIDEFLIKHSERKGLSSVPRTTGRRERCNINELPVSTIHQNNIPSSDQKPSTSGVSAEWSKVDKNKRPRYDETVEVFSNDCSDEDKRTTKCKKQDQGFAFSNHEEESDCSLNNALKSTLAGLPAFTRFNTQKASQPKCASCNDENVLFKVPCSHFICRNCLLVKKKSNDLSCNLCKTLFKSNDPIRHHV